MYNGADEDKSPVVQFASGFCDGNSCDLSNRRDEKKSLIRVPCGITC